MLADLEHCSFAILELLYGRCARQAVQISPAEPEHQLPRVFTLQVAVANRSAPAIGLAFRAVGDVAVLITQ
jgi:hypothetical protein